MKNKCGKNKRYTVTIVGAFDFANEFLGGQVVKTRELYNLMIQKYGNNNVALLDTITWKKHAISLVFRYLFYALQSTSIIMLPAHKGVKIFSRLLYFSKKILRLKIYYDVIGGWLPKLLITNRRLTRILKSFDGIWVETHYMRQSMEKAGFNNVAVINNFKDLLPITKEKVSYRINNFPIRLCVFSRILKEKGIEDAVEVIQKINEKYMTVKLSLDIYGPIDPTYKERFISLKQTFPSYINYNGVADANKSSDILANYSLLLFPTHFKTEGIPGTIIDAYFAGIPVVASRWNSFSDVIDEGKTGFGYEILNNEDLARVLENIIINPKLIYECRSYCLNKAQEYTSDYVFNQIINTGFGN